MIILNLKEDEKYKKRGNLFKRKKEFYSATRENIKINDKMFSIVSLTPDALKSDEILKLIKMNKGRVLETQYNHINEYIGDYLYSYKFYYKKAILSNLYNSLDAIGKNTSFVIEDGDFCQYPEYYMLAKGVRRLSILGECNGSFSEFCQKCFYDFGLAVNDREDNEGNSFRLNLNKIDEKGKAIFYYKLNSGIIYPDPQYFMWNEGVRKLTASGVSFECACSVLSSN